jgi:hypothetical protein
MEDDAVIKKFSLLVIFMLALPILSARTVNDSKSGATTAPLAMVVMADNGHTNSGGEAAPPDSGHTNSGGEAAPPNSGHTNSGGEAAPPNLGDIYNPSDSGSGLPIILLLMWWFGLL